MRQSIDQIPQIRILGRHPRAEGALTLFYTASGIECAFTGSELWLELRGDYGRYEPWITVELNGAFLSRFPVAKGESRVCLFRGMTCGRVKRVRVLKDVQAMFDDPEHLLQILGLSWEDGGFLPLPEPKLRLEFIGDSITSGEGTIGAREETDWISAFFSAREHYARITADALDAQWRILSQSGWGILSGWDNNPRHRVMDSYDRVCGLAQGERNRALGADQPNDFAAWPADAVIVNLGTNDAGAMGNPPWTDPETGSSFCQRKTPGHLRRLEQEVAEILKTLRSRNPRALLVWAYGMLGDDLAPTLRAGVERYSRETGDGRVCFLPLPGAVEQTLGAREHPGPENHRQAAAVLTAFLGEALGQGNQPFRSL